MPTARSTDHREPVIVGYDGSAGSRAAVRAATRLWPDSQLVIATAWTPPGADGSGVVAAYESALASPPADEQAGAGAARTARGGVEEAWARGARSEQVVLRADGGVAEALAGLARARGAEVIAVGRTSAGRIEDLLLGSTPRDLVTRTGFCTLVAPAEPDTDGAAHPAGPVLVAFDGTPPCLSVLDAAASFFASSPATVIRVWDTPLDPPLFDLGAIASAAISQVTGIAREVAELAAEAADKDAREAVARTAAAGLRSEPRTAVGDPASAILAAAEELDASAIVLGGWSGRLGSTTDRVIRRSCRPVLAVPVLDQDRAPSAGEGAVAGVPAS